MALLSHSIRTIQQPIKRSRPTSTSTPVTRRATPTTLPPTRPTLPQSLSFTFDKIGKPITNTLRVASLYDLTAELNTPDGLRNIYGPLIFKATTEVFAEVNAIITRLLEATYAHPPYFLAQALFQPLPRLFTDHSLQRGGGNILGLDREHDNSILLSFIVIWTDPSKDDEVRRLSDAVLGNVTAYTKSVGAYRPWQYVNYAFEDQDLIGSYGDANVEFLRRVSGKYDPRQTFQRLVPGGWKLGMRAGGRRSLISTNSRVLRRCA